MKATLNLKSKGSSVVTATADQPLIQIAVLLATHRIGCVVIVEDNDKVCGIISEHDLIRAVGEAGPIALNNPVSNFMTTAVITACETDTNERLLTEMAASKIRHMPIVEMGRLVGIVSIGGLVKLHVADAEAESASLKRHISSA